MSRELDAEVAEKVMGWTRVIMSGEAWADINHNLIDDYMGSFKGKRTVVPFYSTDISAAWEVVEKMRERGWVMGIGVSDCDYAPDWVVNFTRDPENEDAWIRGIGETAPEAICRAVLEAVKAGS